MSSNFFENFALDDFLSTPPPIKKIFVVESVTYVPFLLPLTCALGNFHNPWKTPVKHYLLLFSSVVSEMKRKQMICTYEIALVA